ncbi:MAG: sigma 54-interacting transcriptional regulator [Deltaproteobacteria bacterium]|nr:sigma 54-interacting transcriptional regulator [Deltaproteobacteria bacterium]
MQGILGEGSWGRVFLLAGPEGRFAAKFLMRGLGQEGELLLREEVRLLSGLAHPGLVRILDFYPTRESLVARLANPEALEGIPPSAPGFLMDFIEGRPLEPEARPIQPDEALDLFRQACEAVQYLHGRGILHRDIKPANFIRDTQGRLKILDFGLSFEKSDEGPRSVRLGTLAYSPPEAYLGGYDERGDIFSLGQVFYQWIGGRAPYDRPLSPAALAGIPSPPSIALHRPEFPGYFCKLLDAMIALSPFERPQSVQAVLAYLALHQGKKPGGVSEENIPKLPLVGRDESLKSFFGAFGAPPNFKPRIALVHGPVGVGRTRFLEEIRWKMLLASEKYLDVSGEAPLSWRRELVSLLAPESRPESSGFWEMQSLCKSRLEGAPWILTFRDLHRWSASDLQELKVFLGLVAGQSPPLRVILEWDSDALSDLGQSLDTSAWEIFEYPLGDLNLADARFLVAGASACGKTEDLLWREIAEKSGGRPLLIVEALRQLSRGGDVAGAKFPLSLRGSVAAKVQALGSEDQRLLARILTALGRPGLRDLIQAGEDNSGGDLGGILRLEGHRILVPGSSRAEFPALAHPALAPAFLESLPPSTVREARRDWLRMPSQGLAARLEQALHLEDREFLRDAGVAALQAVEREGDFQKLFDLSGRLIRLGCEEVDPLWTYISRAVSAYRIGDFEEARRAYGEWRRRKPPDDTGLTELRYRLYLGLVETAAGRGDEARRQLQEAAASVDESSCPESRPYLARARNLIAGRFRETGNRGEAEKNWELALRLAEGDPLLVGEAEQGLGAAALEREEFERAEDHFGRCLEAYHSLEDPQLEAIACHHLAELHRRRGELRKATAWADRAIAFSKKGGEILQAARYAGNAASLRAQLGECRSAFAGLAEAEAVFRSLASESDLRLAALHAAEMLGALGQRELAEKKIAELAPRLDSDTNLRLPLLRLRADGFLRAGSNLKAAAAFTRLSECAEASGSAPFQRVAHFGLWRAEFRAGILSEEGGGRAEQIRKLEQAPFEAARTHARLFSFLASQPERLEAGQFEGLLAALDGLEGWEARLEAYRDLELYFQRGHLPSLAREMAARIEMTENLVFHDIPEVMIMEFPNKRGLRDLERELSPASSEPKAAAVEAAVGTVVTEARFRQFCEINRQILEKDALPEILERVMDAAIELTGSERGFLIMKDEASESEELSAFQVRTARRMHRENLGREESEISWNAVREAFRQGTPLLTDNAQSDPRFAEAKSVVKFQLKSILVVPLELGGKPLGAIYLDHRYEARRFTEQDLLLLSGFAIQTALAIQKANIIQRIKAQQAELASRVQGQEQRIEVLSEALHQTRRQLKFSYDEIVGKSHAMIKVFQSLDQVSRTKIPVWIFGESGTGKELVARALHFNSPRKEKSFVSENCGAIPENLLESELFGCKRGAFTHADRDRAGLFEQADGGTLFLDEVADMPMPMQVKLLRVLQEGEVRPLGGNKPVKVDVRLVTASNRDLRRLVKEGKFREDLFFRTNGMTIRLPPLRERKDDIPLLIHHLMKKISKEYRIPNGSITQEAVQRLAAKPWPGNIRELEGALRSLMLFADGAKIDRQVVEAGELHLDGEVESSAGESAGSLEYSESNAEAGSLLDLMARHHFDKKRVAAELGLSLKSIYNLLEKHRLPTKKSQLLLLLDSHRNNAGKG